MKKSIISLLVLCVSLCAFAQTRNSIDFMGVPMGISINTFKDKLVAKGVSYDKETSRILPEGIKKFTGKFAGYSCDIYVYFGTSGNKKVYHVKVVKELPHEPGTLDDIKPANRVAKNIYAKLQQKYSGKISYFREISILGESDHMFNVKLQDGSIEAKAERYERAGSQSFSYEFGIKITIDYWHNKSYDDAMNSNIDDV